MVLHVEADYRLTKAGKRVGGHSLKGTSECKSLHQSAQLLADKNASYERGKYSVIYGGADSETWGKFDDDGRPVEAGISIIGMRVFKRNSDRTYRRSYTYASYDVFGWLEDCCHHIATSYARSVDFCKRRNLTPQVPMLSLAFHNLNFDGAFIIDALEEMSKAHYCADFTDAMTAELADGIYYTALVSGMQKTMYKIQICVVVNGYRFMINITDTMRRWTASLKEIGGALGVDKMDIEDIGMLPAEAWRLDNHDNRRNVSYFLRDLVLQEALVKHLINEGMFKYLTQGAYAHAKHIEAYGGKKRFMVIFPPEANTDTIRKLYGGGVSWCRTDTAYQTVNFYSFDAVSMYPSQMTLKRMPYGNSLINEPLEMTMDAYCEFRDKMDKEDKYVIARYDGYARNVRTDVPYCMRILRPDGGFTLEYIRGRKTNAKGGHFWTCSWASDVNWQEGRYALGFYSHDAIMRCYEFKNGKVIVEGVYNSKILKETCAFIHKNFAEKKRLGTAAKATNDPALRKRLKTAQRVPKINMNSSYGKLAQRTMEEMLLPFRDENGVIRYRAEASGKPHTPLVAYPFAIAITDAARGELMRVCFLIIAAGGIVYYTDTDSVYTNLAYIPGLSTGDELGDWAFENKGMARFYQPKQYVLACHADDKYTFKVVMAGGGEAVRDALIPHGTTTKSKRYAKEMLAGTCNRVLKPDKNLKGRRVRGGVVLVPATSMFAMNGSVVGFNDAEDYVELETDFIE